MKRKIKVQKGFIKTPLLIAIISSVILGSVVIAGGVLIKQGKLKLTANVSESIKQEQSPSPTIEPTAEPVIESLEPTKKPVVKNTPTKPIIQTPTPSPIIISPPQPIQPTQPTQQQINDLQAEQKRQEELIRQQEIERQRQLEEKRLVEEQRNQEKQLLESILIEKINSQISQASSIASQIDAKQAEINTIINEYNQGIENARNALAPMSFINGRIAKLEREKQAKLVIPYQELQSLINQYNTLTGNPISLVIPQKTTVIPQYLTFYPNSSGGGDIYDSSGSYHINVEKTSGGYTLYFNY